jgi:hypothetical protein
MSADLEAARLITNRSAWLSDKEGPTAETKRHLAEARLPPGKKLDSFDFEAVPVISKAQLTVLAAGDAWLNKGANLRLFGPPGGGKSHLAAALDLALLDHGGCRRYVRWVMPLLEEGSSQKTRGWREPDPNHRSRVRKSGRCQVPAIRPGSVEHGL